MSGITLGKYVPYNSFIHRLDPRGKLAFVVALMICVFINFTSLSTSFIFLGLLLVLVGLFLYISKMSLSSIFSSLKSLWIIVVVLLVLYSLLPVNEPKLGIIFKVGDWVVYWDSALEALKVILRLVIMLSLTMMLTATTKPLALTYALEWYLKPLKAIKFPVSEIAMTISIALRFIPTLLDDTKKIMKAQESRGVDFAKGNIIRKITSLTSLVVPLFVSAFMRSEELANAMECRCYNPRAKRTKYRELSWTKYDTLCVLIANVLLILFIVSSIIHLDILSIFGVSSL